MKSTETQQKIKLLVSHLLLRDQRGWLWLGFILIIAHLSLSAWSLSKGALTIVGSQIVWFIEATEIKVWNCN